jgi:hypothetical protein
MAKFSMKMGGKEVGPASVYAKPHTMSGGPVKDGRANMSKVDTVDASVGNLSKSAGDIGTKTSGIKMRGTGAATKGTMCRGTMA